MPQCQEQLLQRSNSTHTQIHTTEVLYMIRTKERGTKNRAKKKLRSQKAKAYNFSFATTANKRIVEQLRQRNETNLKRIHCVIFHRSYLKECYSMEK